MIATIGTLPIAATIYMTSHLATDWHDHHSTTQYRDHQHLAPIPRVHARACACACVWAGASPVLIARAGTFLPSSR